MSARIHDFVAIGLGPFNLGLACLSDPLELDGVFLEARGGFDWHRGMMLEDATLQVPFLADLVTLADPTSPYSFLSYLKESGRLYPFYIRESFYPLRREYNRYCQWAARRLDSVRFGQRVTRVGHDGASYVVTTDTGAIHRGRRLVLGTGTTPVVPDALAPLLDEASVSGEDGPTRVLHSASYLDHREELRGCGRITIVGSGQSAAEVYADLLAAQGEHGYALDWVTRSPRFFPMEYTKLTLEMTSPEYTAYFQQLPAGTRERLLNEQRGLYKGISGELVNDIYDTLYARSVDEQVETTLLTSCEVTAARRVGDRIAVDVRHAETGSESVLETDAVVLATGYRAEVPAFLDGVRERIRWDVRGRYAATATYAVTGPEHGGEEIFVQNGEEHTHGFVAPDLGMGAYRNSIIINEMLGREIYPVEQRIAFQQFGVPSASRAMAETVR